MSASTFPRKVPANSEIRIIAAGEFVFMVAATSAELIVKNDDQNFRFPMAAGDNYRLPRGVFEYIDIVNPSEFEADISVIIGSGQFDSNQMTATVSHIDRVGAISDPVKIDELAGSKLQSIGVIEEIAPIDLDGVICKRGSVGSSVVELASPSSNVDGIIVYYCEMRSSAGRIMMKENAPTGYADGSAFSLLETNWHTGGANPAGGQREQILLVPPGFGLYVTSYSSSYLVSYCINYKVL